MKLINILILFLVCFCLKQLKPNFCSAENKYKTKTVKELIHDNLMEAGNSEGEIFTLIFQKILLDKGNVLYKLNSGELIIGKRGPQLTDEEYFSLFGRHLDKTIIGTLQFDLEQALVDSVCAYNTQPELSRKRLTEIIKNTHLISSRKKEIKELFLENHKLLEDKFNRKKIVDSVLKELIPTVQTYPQEEQLVPTLPEHLI